MPELAGSVARPQHLGARPEEHLLRGHLLKDELPVVQLIGLVSSPAFEREFVEKPGGVVDDEVTVRHAERHGDLASLVNFASSGDGVTVAIELDTRTHEVFAFFVRVVEAQGEHSSCWILGFFEWEAVPETESKSSREYRH